MIKIKILLFFLFGLGTQAYSQLITCSMSLADGAGGFKNGKTYEPGDIIYVTGAGNLSYGFPAAGALYILHDNDFNDGYVSFPLQDALSVMPNVIQSYLGGAVYIDEVIAIGPLPEGKFDIVIDKNSNQVYDFGIDCYVGEGNDYAFNVLAGEIPAWRLLELQKIKEDAILAWLEALDMLEAGQRTFMMIEVVRLLGDISKAVIGGKSVLNVFMIKAFEKVAGVSVSYDGNVIRIGKLIVLTVLGINELHYKGIAADPPDHDYKSVAPTEQIHCWRPESNHPYVKHQAGLVNSYAMENIALDGIFHSMEKIQGASADRTDASLRLQAIGLTKYIDLWKEANEYKFAAVDSIITYMTQNNMRDTIDKQKVQALRDRIVNTGFTEEERQDLVGKYNLSESALDTMRQHFAEIDTSLLYQGTAIEYLNSVKSFFSAVQVTMDSLKAKAQLIVTNVNPTLQDIWPHASIIVPASVVLGSPVTLSGMNSNTSVINWAWDLDKDSLYDDGNTQNVTFTPVRAGLHLVSLKVTNQLGKVDYAYKVIDVQIGNKPAVITSNSPAQDYVLIDGSQPFPTFSISATDPESDVISYEWLSDGNFISTSSSYNSANDTAMTNSFAACKKKLHEVFVEVTDAGSVYKTGYIWNVFVNPVPTVKLPADTGLCVGCLLTLNAASFSHASYSWSTGQTTPMISVNTPGTYIVHTSANGCTASDTIVITTSTSGIILAEHLTALTIYPNPSSGDFNIEYSLKEEGLVKMEVYNVIGKLVATIIDHQQQYVGDYKHSLSSASWGDTNVYFLKISVNDNHSLTRKLILVKQGL